MDILRAGGRTLLPRQGGKNPTPEQPQHAYQIPEIPPRLLRKERSGRDILQDLTKHPQQAPSEDLPLMTGPWKVDFERWQMNATRLHCKWQQWRSLFFAFLNIIRYQLTTPLYHLLKIYLMIIVYATFLL